jgi:hypothetical protein
VGGEREGGVRGERKTKRRIRDREGGRGGEREKGIEGK